MKKKLLYGLIALIVIIALAILGVLLNKNYKQNKYLQPKTSLQSDQILKNQNLNNTSTLKTYKNEEYKFGFKYPQNWTINESYKGNSLILELLGGDGLSQLQISNYPRGFEEVSNDEFNQKIKFLKNNFYAEIFGNQEIGMAIIKTIEFEKFELNTSTWKIYKNSYLGVSLKYPSEWDKEEFTIQCYTYDNNGIKQPVNTNDICLNLPIKDSSSTDELLRITRVSSQTWKQMQEKENRNEIPRIGKFIAEFNDYVFFLQPKYGISDFNIISTDTYTDYINAILSTFKTF